MNTSRSSFSFVNLLIIQQWSDNNQLPLYYKERSLLTWQTTFEKPPPRTREKLQHSLRVFRTQDGVDNHPRRDCTEITANDKPEPVFNTRGRARAAITREMSERKLAVFPTELLSVKVPTEFTCLAVLCGVHPIKR